MVITCIIYSYYCIFASQTKKQIVMNTSEFILRSEYLLLPAYVMMNSCKFEFQSLHDLLLFYRFLLDDGYEYEFQLQRFVKVNPLNNLINFIYLV